VSYTSIVLAFTLAISLWSAEPSALPQRTGGRAGGSSSSSGGSGSSGGGGGGGGGGGDGGEALVEIVFCLVLLAFSDDPTERTIGCSGLTLLFILFAGYCAWSAIKSGRKAAAAKMEARGPPMDVSVVMLGIDWRARERIQKTLKDLAQASDLATGPGLRRFLCEVSDLLRRHEVSWLYSGAINYENGLSKTQAESAFQTATTAAASRYKEEVIRNMRGALTEQTASDVRPRVEEGPGVVVVTLAVSARRELPDIRNVRDALCLRAALDSFSKLLPEQIAAVEVIWSPAEEKDRMSTAELEILYPELKKIDEASLAGRAFCKACGGPFAAELRTCPHCGTPI